MGFYHHLILGKDSKKPESALSSCEDNIFENGETPSKMTNPMLSLPLSSFVPFVLFVVKSPVSPLRDLRVLRERYINSLAKPPRRREKNQTPRYFLCYLCFLWLIELNIRQQQFIHFTRASCIFPVSLHALRALRGKIFLFPLRDLRALRGKYSSFSFRFYCVHRKYLIVL